MQKGVAHAQTSAVRLKSLRLNSFILRFREVRFAADSPVEGDGFELPIPQGRPNKQRRQSSTLIVREPSFGVRPTRCRKSKFGPLGFRRERRVPYPLISRHEWILSAVRATFSIAGNQRETRVTSP
jgi:hypothetical protein